MNPGFFTLVFSALYLAWSKLCENVGCKEPIGWILQKLSDCVYFIGKLFGCFVVKTAKKAVNKLQENMAKAKPEAQTAEAAQPADVIDVKASEPTK